MEASFGKTLVRGALQVLTYALGAYFGLVLYEKLGSNLGERTEAAADTFLTYQ